MPYPAKFVKVKPGDSPLEVEDQAIIYFLAPDYLQGTMTEEQYWDLTNRLLSLLAERYPKSPLYVKLHPSDVGDALRHLMAPGWRVLKKTVSPEEISIWNRGRIRAVYSACSSSSLTAAAFDIPSYVTYPLVLGPRPMMGYWDRFFSPAAGKLFTVHEWDGLGRGEVPRGDDPGWEGRERSRWEQCLRELISAMRSRVGK